MLLAPGAWVEIVRALPSCEAEELQQSPGPGPRWFGQLLDVVIWVASGFRVQGYKALSGACCRQWHLRKQELTAVEVSLQRVATWRSWVASPPTSELHSSENHLSCCKAGTSLLSKSTSTEPRSLTASPEALKDFRSVVEAELTALGLQHILEPRASYLSEEGAAKLWRELQIYADACMTLDTFADSVAPKTLAVPAALLAETTLLAYHSTLSLTQRLGNG